eukprot:8969946-Pyramimonas_sp.AAC.1
MDPHNDFGRDAMENAFYTNMQLLGIGCGRKASGGGSLEVDGDRTCTITPNMFRTSNLKGMEFVMYHLLCKIKPETAKKARSWTF